MPKVKLLILKSGQDLMSMMEEVDSELRHFKFFAPIGMEHVENRINQLNHTVNDR
jgi:hypothetical protein